MALIGVAELEVQAHPQLVVGQLAAHGGQLRVRDLLSERWAEDAALVGKLREWLWADGLLRSKLVEGKAEMDVNYSLEPWELKAGFILTCQAKPTTDRVVVDYDHV